MAVEGEFLDLGEHKQPGGKTIVALAREGDFDSASLKSNTFAIEWPPHSGRVAQFPEVDRAAWCSIGEATEKEASGQRPIIAALAEKLGVKGPDVADLGAADGRLRSPAEGLRFALLIG